MHHSGVSVWETIILQRSSAPFTYKFTKRISTRIKPIFLQVWVASDKIFQTDTVSLGTRPRKTVQCKWYKYRWRLQVHIILLTNKTSCQTAVSLKLLQHCQQWNPNFKIQRIVTFAVYGRPLNDVVSDLRKATHQIRFIHREVNLQSLDKYRLTEQSRRDWYPSFRLQSWTGLYPFYVLFWQWLA